MLTTREVLLRHLLAFVYWKIAISDILKMHDCVKVLTSVQSFLVRNPSGIRHLDLRPVTFYDHFSL
jgi:hypothetical protein